MSCHVLFWIPTRLQRDIEASDNVFLDKVSAIVVPYPKRPTELYTVLRLRKGGH
jgi:hypothetical protein